MLNRIESHMVAMAIAQAREVHLGAVKAAVDRIKAVTRDMNIIAQTAPDVDAYSARAALELLADKAEELSQSYYILAAERAAQERYQP